MQCQDLTSVWKQNMVIIKMYSYCLIIVQTDRRWHLCRHTAFSGSGCGDMWGGLIERNNIALFSSAADATQVRDGQRMRGMWMIFLTFSPIRLRSPSPLLFQSGSLKKRKHKITPLCSPKTMLFGYQDCTSGIVLAPIPCGWSNLLKILAPAHEGLRSCPSTVLYSHAASPAKWRYKRGRGVPGGDREPSEGSQNSCAHLASSVRTRTEGGRRNITGHDRRRSRDNWLFAGLWAQTFVN